MNAVAKKTVRLTLNQRKAEEIIQSQLQNGSMLVDIGIISQEQYEQGKHQLADFTVKIESDTKLADEVATAKDGGQAAFERIEGTLGAGAVEAIADANSDEGDESNEYDHDVELGDMNALMAALMGTDNDDEG
jgi:hypothetical protein